MENLLPAWRAVRTMKYSPLGAYLDSLDESPQSLDISDIESVLAFRLPNSARQKSFWSNNRQGKAQAGPGWLNVGWRVQAVRHTRGRVAEVTFCRIPGARREIVGVKEEVTEEEVARLMRPNLLSPHMFHYSAGDHMMDHYGEAMLPGEVSGINHRFDFVSDDKKIVGEMRLYKSVPKRGVHSSTFASISEAVLLLQHVQATHKFVVFGGDQRVPEAWLARHAALAEGVAFHFIRENGKLLTLQDAPTVRDLSGGG